ncbi:MAG: hypothetical protein RMZ69_26740 [Nostoc sp. ChiQUE01a]|nr:hypothetical protein [Nostoc sp. ChiQUE01a]
MILKRLPVLVIRRQEKWLNLLAAAFDDRVLAALLQQIFENALW